MVSVTGHYFHNNDLPTLKHPPVPAFRKRTWKIITHHLKAEE